MAVRTVLDISMVRGLPFTTGYRNRLPFTTGVSMATGIGYRNRLQFTGHIATDVYFMQGLYFHR